MRPRDLAWLEKLVTAIAAADAGPSAADLADAPVIDLWLPLAAGSGAIALCCYASDHPRLGNVLIHDLSHVTVEVSREAA